MSEVNKVLAMHEIVAKLAQEVEELLYKGTEHVPDPQRWLVYSRVIMFVFQRHFKLSFRAASEEKP
jgi:hypothetical protein